MPHQAILLKAHEIARVGPVTAALLADVFDRVRDHTSLIAREPPTDTAQSA